VLVYHLIEMGSWRKFPRVYPWKVFRIGWIGVDLFLVISGFVITYSAVRDFRKSEAGFKRRFMTRRLLRIMPLYVLTTLVYLLLNPGTLSWPPGTLAQSGLRHIRFPQRSELVARP